MKRLLLPVLLFFFFGAVFVPASWAAGSRTVTILYTGSVQGTIDPCHV